MPAATTTVHIACLCAAWCRLCDDYAPVLQAVATELRDAGVIVHTHWIDIEDDANLVDDIDVETFPTIVLVHGDRVRFAGPITPQAETLRRLVRATALEPAADASSAAIAPEFRALAARLLEHVDAAR